MAEETVRQPRPTGMPLAPGDHVCGFYYGEHERDALLLPFLQAGLSSGDKCLAVVDSITPSDIALRVSIRAGDAVDVDACLATGQLELYDSEQTYLRTGEFDLDSMIDFWEQRASRNSTESRYPFARVAGEMSWLARVRPDREVIVRYETWADRFASEYPHAVLCLYDLHRLGSGVLFDLLMTHPKLMLGGLVLENPHHISGEEFVAARA